MGLKYLVKYFFDPLAFICDYVSFAPASRPVSLHVVFCSSWDWNRIPVCLSVCLSNFPRKELHRQRRLRSACQTHTMLNRNQNRWYFLNFLKSSKFIISRPPLSLKRVLQTKPVHTRSLSAQTWFSIRCYIQNFKNSPEYNFPSTVILTPARAENGQFALYCHQFLLIPAESATYYTGK